MDIKILNNIEITTDEQYRDFIKDCYDYASTSNHPKTHMAALLVDNGKVILRGINVLPKGVKNLKERFEGNNKHIYLNHAERDLIYKAAKNGIKTQGLTMITLWPPCILCANAIISSGIKKVVIHKQMAERAKKKWEEELQNAARIMEEAGVKIFAYDGVVGAKGYLHGQEWDA